jgi:hypothetical protein
LFEIFRKLDVTGNPILTAVIHGNFRAEDKQIYFVCF